MELFSDSDSERDKGTIVAPEKGNGSLSPKLTVNESYANRFEHNKQRAELHQLEEKYGKRAAEILLGKRHDDAVDDSETDDEDSSEDETEDDEGEQVTAEVDAAILRTLAKIRSGDASIYNADARVFDEEKALAATSALLPKATRAKIGRKVTLADYQRNRLKDLMADSANPALALAEATTSRTREDDLANGEYEDYSQQPLSHVQEQEQLRRQVTQAFHDADGQGEEGDPDFFTKTGAGGADGEDEDAGGSYRRYLLETLGGEKAQTAVREALRTQIEGAAPQHGNGAAAGPSSEPTIAATKRKSNKGDVEARHNEDFLMNYILNRGWLENPQAAPKLGKQSRVAADEEDEEDEKSGALPAPTRGSNGDTYGRDWDTEAADLDSEASFDSRAEAFEQAFNFRFEAMESGDAPAQVQSYARNPQNSVRRVEEKRKTEREERKKRKESEKKARIEELDRMRSLKKGLLRDKLKQLQEAAGSSRIDFDPDALQGDYDPEKHDAMMAAFGDEYYDEEDTGADGLMKPTWDDDDLDIADILAEEEEENDLQASNKSKKDKKQRKKGKQATGGDDDDGPIDMDVDFINGADGGSVDESKLSKKELKKLKKKQKALLAHQAGTGAPQTEELDGVSSGPMPQTDEERKAEAKRLADEYRNLDYEDVVGDLPTRFRYTQVPKVDYGMSAVEILLADDKDLNDVVGLKHLLPYRKGAGKRPKDLNRKLGEFRRKLDAKSGERSQREGAADEGPMKKRLGRKERQKARAAAATAEGDGGAAVQNQGEDASVRSAFAGASTATAPETVSEEAARVQRRKEKKERKRAAEAAAGEGGGQRKKKKAKVAE